VLTQDFDYDLPKDRIAQRPLAERDASLMLQLNRATGAVHDTRFAEFAEQLRGDELLVFNNARVIPARLFGRRVGAHVGATSITLTTDHPSGTVEVFLARQVSPDTWEALVRPGRKLPIGEQVIFGDGELAAEIVDRGDLGLRSVRLSSRNGESLVRLIEQLGHVPLPPYIDREDESSDRERYQTVFAKNPGAVAAPTAGLHFSPEVLSRLREKGIESCEITLDVGLGTFQPIHSEDLSQHVMHAESYEISEDSAAKIAAARQAKRAIVAIGTTVVRALEDSAQRACEAGTSGLLLSGRSEARIFITPGFEFKVVNALLTNFHLPRSTLLALVCAFAGRENVLAAYRHAVKSGYRFYSYGDCMFIR